MQVADGGVWILETRWNRRAGWWTEGRSSACNSDREGQGGKAQARQASGVRGARRQQRHSLEPLKPTQPSRGVVSAHAHGNSAGGDARGEREALTDPEEVWEMVDEDDDWML